MHEHVGLLRKRSVWRSRSAAALCLVLPDGLEPPLLSRNQSVDFRHCFRGKSPAWGADHRRRNNAPPGENMFPYREPDPGLLFIPNQRQISVKGCPGPGPGRLAPRV